MENFHLTPYRICIGLIFIDTFNSESSSHKSGKFSLFLLHLLRQNEYSFQHLRSLYGVNSWATAGSFEGLNHAVASDINQFFDIAKWIRDCHSDNNSVCGLYLRKLAIQFNRLTHQACSQLYDEFVAYIGNVEILARRHLYRPWPPLPTRSVSSSLSQTIKPIYQVNREMTRLQANEHSTMNPKEMYECLRLSGDSTQSDVTFLRYLNLLRVNESVGSKHLLMAYFDMVSDTVSRSYSALNYAIWYLHHGEYKRAIECLQECYCCAQAADDDKCLLIALMWLARIVIQANQKNSSKYNVRALLELVRKRSHKAGMPYVEAMASMTLEQLNGPVDDGEQLKKSSETLKQVASTSRQHNHLLTNANQPNPLDKDDSLPTAEILAVRNSMNDVLAMYYALSSAHSSMIDANQTSALTSQVLLHFDLIEKCGNDDVFVVNENTFIALRNLAFHVWNSTRDIQLVREILVDLCSNKIPTHRTDHHAIWRQALSEISFEYYVEQENWSEATKMIFVIRETDQAGAQLRQAELLYSMGVYDEALHLIVDLIRRIKFEETNLTDPVKPNGTSEMLEVTESGSTIPSLSIEHKTYIKAKALLLRAIMLDDETNILESLHYATENRFQHLRTACLMQLAKRWVHKADSIMDSIVIEVFANGTRKEKRELLQLLQESSVN